MYPGNEIAQNSQEVVISSLMDNKRTKETVGENTALS
jgi:hypothetical protein